MNFCMKKIGISHVNIKPRMKVVSLWIKMKIKNTIEITKGSEQDLNTLNVLGDIKCH